MTPKLPGCETSVPGAFHIGWLKALTASRRNSAKAISRIGNRLNREPSNARVPGGRRSGEVSEVLPKLKLPACENVDWSKNEFTRSAIGPDFLADLPLLLGRCPGEP